MKPDELVMAAAGSSTAGGGGGGGSSTLYVDDVFSTYLYTGNGSTQTINNGVDLAGNGGLVWIKNRGVADNHQLTNTVSSEFGTVMSSNLTDADTWVGAINTPSTSGFSVGSYGTGSYNVNKSGQSYTSWTFRKAPKFFDIVTYTGDGAASRTISHNLGIRPGLITVKATSAVSDWEVLCRGSDTSWPWLKLNTTAAGGGPYNVGADVGDSTFTVGGIFPNANGVQYVAYIFAHDPSATGMIQCGSFTTDGSGNATVNLGWEPQWILAKRSNSATGGNWRIIDNMRGMPVNSAGGYLVPNAADVDSSASFLYPTSTGFYSNSSSIVEPSAPYIYMAIRRPNKPPTSGTQVYNAFLSNSAHPGVIPKFLSNFVVDLFMFGPNIDSSPSISLHPRLLPGYGLQTTSTSVDSSSTYSSSLGWGYNNGVHDNGGFYEGTPDMGWMFRRAPGVFDVVCYTGTGIGSRVLSHSLNTIPELMIFKSRTTTTDDNWTTYFTTASAVNKTYSLNTNGFYTGTPTSALTTTTITLNDNTTNNTVPYVVYLFASLAGISKVGEYTGNGTSLTINCGFAAGARFILIRRATAAGDWYIWDTTRGIVGANDPHLSLNTTAVEVTTDDSIDPDNSGFIVNQVSATNINVSSATYIYLAIA